MPKKLYQRPDVRTTSDLSAELDGSTDELVGFVRDAESVIRTIPTTIQCLDNGIEPGSESWEFFLADGSCYHIWLAAP